MKRIIDTNVAVVAGGESPQASPACVVACRAALRRMVAGKDTLVIDDGWRILREYKRNIHPANAPRPDAEFLLWAYENHRNPSRCECVCIHDSNDGLRAFDEFPGDSDLAGFHRNDRKFVAVSLAIADPPPVVVAIDDGWWEHREALNRHGVRVEFICEEDICELAK
jgi:hypothetical protein